MKEFINKALELGSVNEIEKMFISSNLSRQLARLRNEYWIL